MHKSPNHYTVNNHEERYAFNIVNDIAIKEGGYHEARPSILNHIVHVMNSFEHEEYINNSQAVLHSQYLAVFRDFICVLLHFDNVNA